MLEMSSPEAGPSSYDYTEGASAIDIDNALDNTAVLDVTPNTVHIMTWTVTELCSLDLDTL